MVVHALLGECPKTGRHVFSDQVWTTATVFGTELHIQFDDRCPSCDEPLQPVGTRAATMKGGRR
jgi:hypothetical protein